jgi:hypothetical protein
MIKTPTSTPHKIVFRHESGLLRPTIFQPPSRSLTEIHPSTKSIGTSFGTR